MWIKYSNCNVLPNLEIKYLILSFIRDAEKNSQVSCELKGTRAGKSVVHMYICALKYTYSTVGREQQRAFLSIYCAKITRLLLASDGVALPFYLPGFILCWAPFCEYEITTGLPWQLHAFVTLLGKKLLPLLPSRRRPFATAGWMDIISQLASDLPFRLTVGDSPLLPVNWSHCWN